MIMKKKEKYIPPEAIFLSEGRSFGTLCVSGSSNAKCLSGEGASWECFTGITALGPSG